ncbi:MAG: SPOR domain-containing protein [Pseudomonadota bacterium]
MAKRRRKKRAASHGSGFAEHMKSMLVGLIAGIALAITAWWYLGKPAAPPEPVAAKSAEASAPAKKPTVADKPANIEATGKDFDFYDMLPEQEIVIHDSATDRKPRQDAVVTRPPEVTEPGVYRIQAGSFTRFEDADRRKAQLALLGIQSTIEAVMVREKRVHRVIVGPLNNPQTVTDYQGRLAAANIEMITTQERP